MVSDDAERSTSGVCGAATYELAVEEEDGRTEATFELQSSAPGETWDIVVTQDGTPILRGSRLTDEDGEVDLDVPADAAADALERLGLDSRQGALPRDARPLTPHPLTTRRQHPISTTPTTPTTQGEPS